MIVCAKIDDDGYFIEDIIIHKGEEIPLNCIKNRPNTKEVGFYKAKWDGANWIEGMTQIEKDELNNQPKVLTENEMIMLAIADLAEIVLGGIE